MSQIGQGRFCLDANFDRMLQKTQASWARGTFEASRSTAAAAAAAGSIDGQVVFQHRHYTLS